MSSLPTREAPAEAMRAALGRMLDRPVADVERIGGGRNSQVYKVSAQGKLFALKIYFRHPNDRRDRLATEYNSFSYLWANGIREVPQAVAIEPKLGWALYQFIEGQKVPLGEVSDNELLVAADFLAQLRELSRKPESRRLETASEAFFATTPIVANVRERLARLCAAEKDSSNHAGLRSFLQDEFTPLLDQVARASEARLSAVGTTFEQELAWNQRTLSPSDFGFHNALRRPDGRIIFLDFEYFGWDDPAKMIADFLLHPAMDLPTASKKKFASAMFQRFADWPELAARVQSLYPLFGLKWCLILLNEFLADPLLRRQFAATAPADRSALQNQQLDKARQMLNRIRREHQCFPYHD